ncbi:hypothetical protein GGR54DRAFT_105255 [Hypoxylon sp. NC1633]|nr:hypothetical protein GGR54DRAFT_105255 [Hypoxylon sp. NC1633]
MTFNIFEDQQISFYFFFSLACGFVGLVAVILRFSATKLSARKIAIEDWLALAAVTVYVTRITCVLLALAIANGRSVTDNLEDSLETGGKAFMDDYEKGYKLILFADVTAMLDQSLSKWSICALYYRIFGVNRTYARWILAIAVLQGLTYIGLLITQLLQCRPLNKFWQFWAEGECFSFSYILIAWETPNSLIDFALVALALVMIRPMQIKVSTKWKLRFLFGLGSLAGIFGFVKIGLSYNPDRSYTTAVLGIWAAIQSLACIVCCCAPVFKPLMPEGGVWKRITSVLSTRSFGSSRKYETSVRSGTPGSPRHMRTNSQTAQGQRWLRYDSPSSKWTVTRGTSDCPEVDDKNYLMGSIQIQRSIDVTSGQIDDTSSATSSTRALNYR